MQISKYAAHIDFNKKKYEKYKKSEYKTHHHHAMHISLSRSQLTLLKNSLSRVDVRGLKNYLPINHSFSRRGGQLDFLAVKKLLKFSLL